MKRRAWLTLCTCGLGACAGALSQVGQVVTYLSARDAEQRLEQIFAAYQIPVQEHAPDGRVASGQFDPKALWGAAVESRVLCGRGYRDNSIQVDHLEVLGTIRQSVSGPVRVEVESYGAGRNADGKKYPCRLDQATVGAILKGIPKLGRPGSSPEAAFCLPPCLQATRCVSCVPSCPESTQTPSAPARSTRDQGESSSLIILRGASDRTGF
jgi:hypothetical protein